MAIQLTATDTHLVSASAPLVSAQGPLTLMSWINHQWSSTETASIVGTYLSGSTGIQIGTRANPSIDIWTWGGLLLVTTNGTGYIPPDSTWLHIAYTFNGTTHILYANGIQVSTSTTAQTAGILTQMYINGYPTGVTNETSTAIVDDMILFGRVLTQPEIMSIYMAGGARDGATFGVINKYRFLLRTTGSAVTTVRDLSGNGHDLVSEGAGSSMLYTPGIVDIDARPVFG